MKNVSRIAIAIAAGILCSACLADVRTWGGGSGKWSVPANWEGGAVPQDGDSVVINAEADLIELENDISDLSLVKLTLSDNSQTGAIILTGEKLTFTKVATVLDATCVFTNSMPLVFPDNVRTWRDESADYALVCNLRPDPLSGTVDIDLGGDVVERLTGDGRVMRMNGGLAFDLGPFEHALVRIPR